MRSSSDRILTSHVGSLPRPQDVTELVFAREAGEAVDAATFDATVARAVHATVTRQHETGIDIPSDGEMSKISYATYIKDRFTGFDGDAPRHPPADLKAYPSFMKKLAEGGGTPRYKRPQCVGPIAVKDLTPLDHDIAALKLAMQAAGYEEGFMNSASPGVIALFQPSLYHERFEDYLSDLAEAMRHEYNRIVESGLILQIDAPDLGLGRHMMYSDADDETFLRQAALHVEALNQALRDVPGDRVRVHICWGNYEGPHHCDIGLERVLPVVLCAKPRALLFESANPRHGHEWAVFEHIKLPDDYLLIPGCLDSTTNFVEHPELVAQRLERFAGIVGRERIIAGSDCGFATFAGFGVVDAEIVYAKLASLVEGARLASERLWRRAA